MKRREFLYGAAALGAAALSSRIPLPTPLPAPAPIGGLHYDIVLLDDLKESPHVTVVEEWTVQGGHRKIGDGPWKRIEPWGFVPYVWLSSGFIEVETWVTPAEAKALNESR